MNASPVIIEDDALIGGNTGVYEGTIVRRRAVLAAGTVLTRGTPVYDLVRGEVYKATAEMPLVIPEGAVVVPGSRAVSKGKGAEWGLSLAAPVIVKYRDEKTELSLALRGSSAVNLVNYGELPDSRGQLKVSLRVEDTPRFSTLF